MRPKRRALLGAGAALAVAACAALSVSQAKYEGLTVLYRENREGLQGSARQLRALMEQVKRGEEFRDDPLYIEVKLSSEEAEVTLRRFGRTEKGYYDTVCADYPAGDFPDLAEELDALGRAGLSSIEVYDFSIHGEGGSPCEVWFRASGVDGSLACSESGGLTYAWDVTMADGPGYHLFQKRLDKNWFAAVSRYDPDSGYWRY